MKRWVNISEAVEITNNRVRPFKGERRYLATGDLIGEEINGSIVSVDYETKPSRADLLVNKGNIIVARMQATNKVLLIDKNTEDLIVSTGFLTLQPQKEFDGNFLAHYLRSEIFQREKNKYCSGATQKAINNGSFCNLKAPSYPLDEQKKIARILDRADALRRKRKQSLQLLDDFLRATFLDMFGDLYLNGKKWPKRNLRDVCEKFSDGPFGSNLKTEHYRKSGVRIIRLQNIGVGEFIDNDKAYIHEDHYKTIQKHTCLPGDILIATMGNPNIRACILPHNINVAINKADCVQCRPKKEVILPEFLCHFFNTSAALAFISNFLHGQTRTRVSMGQLSKIDIPIPPLKMQNQFLKITASMGSTKIFMSKSMDEMDNQFNALTQRYFG